MESLKDNSENMENNENTDCDKIETIKLEKSELIFEKIDAQYEVREKEISLHINVYKFVRE